MTALYSRLYSFDPKISFKERTLDELNALCNKMNYSKVQTKREYSILFTKIQRVVRHTKTMQSSGYSRRDCKSISGSYSKMYYDIVKSDPLIRGEYPYGNPFDHIIDIMNYGAIIIRFKYVSRNSSLPPEEKIVSYHVMRVKEKYVLGLHMQADKTFSMYKQWGKGDHMLTPIYPEYQNTIVGWGKEDVTKAVLEHDNKRQYNSNKEKFLY
jgi:uncharacterized coiled-coil protein SlyX